MHFALPALAALAAAAPALAQADEIREYAKEQLSWQVKQAIKNSPAQTEQQLSSLPIDTQQLLIGGGTQYAPYKIDCPQGVTWVRSASDGLGQGEKDYISKRQPGIDSAFKNMMAAAGLGEAPRTPVISLALSGGGYRAMINGLGMTMATMNKSEEAKNAGTGGWLDAVTYMAGLSGGSWGTGSFMANDGMLPTDLVNQIWNLQSNLVFPDDDKLSFYYNLLSNVRAKAGAGFPTQITDYWALALGNHLLPSQYHLDKSPNYTFAQLPTTVSALQNAALPMPIIIAAEREPGEVVIGDNATVWEFTPWEFGSWAIGKDTNKTAGYFTPIEYMGSSINNGQSNGTCYRGFDQMSFVMGTSSTLFNQGILQLQNMNQSGLIQDAIKDILKEIGTDKNDVSQIPNSFYGYNAQENPLSNFEYITLIDAGETNQNIPLEPLLMPPRKVDAILAFDNSADTTYSWPNGSALWTTYSRAKEFSRLHNIEIRMPEVPSTNGFVNEGLNQRPVFFGCNRTDVPMVVYVPHYPWTWYSNSSTYQLSYDNNTAHSQIESAMRSFTLNGTVPTWPKCLACALSDRAFGYDSNNRSAECTECFGTWCWSGVDTQSEPSGDYEPVMGVTPTFFAQKNLSTTIQTAGISQAEVTKKPGAAKGLLAGPTLAAAALGAALGAAALL